VSHHVILLFGHTRPEALQFVLEGLKRQGALADTQVWLDGHQNFVDLRPRVEACQYLERLYPDATWIKYGSRCGHVKIFLDAVLQNCTRYRFIIALEDDCFPAPHAIKQLLDTVDTVGRDPDLFSAYGHHFGTADEGAETTAFQNWGWASPSDRLRPVAEELAAIWNRPEPDAVAWFRNQLTDDIRARMDVFPGRAESKLLANRFCLDAALAFLIAKRRLRNRKTPSHVIHNFGIGAQSGHFPHRLAFLFRPPFNMTSRTELITRFGLNGLPDTDQLLIMSGHYPERYRAALAHPGFMASKLLGDARRAFRQLRR
jgi:hypothetical protein